jgi:hypothetical protein
MSRTIAVFSRSAAKAMRFVNLCVVLIAVCGMFAAGVLPSPRIQDFEFFAFVGFVMSAIALGIGLVYLLRRRRPLLEITVDGIRDRRVSSQLVPWAAIATVSVEAVGRRKMLVLDLEAAAGKRLTRAPSQAARANRRGLTISMTGLNGTFEDLVEALRRAEEATRNSR